MAQDVRDAVSHRSKPETARKSGVVQPRWWEVPDDEVAGHKEKENEAPAILSASQPTRPPAGNQPSTLTAINLAVGRVMLCRPPKSEDHICFCARQSLAERLAKQRSWPRLRDPAKTH